MHKDEVPQEDNSTLSGGRKAVYAVGEDGNYAIVTSTGSKVEETVTSQAINELHRLRDESRERVEAGLASPLEYHMYDRRMDILTLAQSVGMFTWRVRYHLKPKVFPKLRRNLLKCYAEALGLSTETLGSIPPDKSITDE
ncbi:MAG: hypothetical protein ABFS08_00530 [Pseudomonadota bacterium]